MPPNGAAQRPARLCGSDLVAYDSPAPRLSGGSASRKPLLLSCQPTHQHDRTHGSEPSGCAEQQRTALWRRTNCPSFICTSDGSGCGRRCRSHRYSKWLAQLMVSGVHALLYRAAAVLTTPALWEHPHLVLRDLILKSVVFPASCYAASTQQRCGSAGDASVHCFVLRGPARQASGCATRTHVRFRLGGQSFLPPFIKGMPTPHKLAGCTSHLCSCTGILPRRCSRYRVVCATQLY